MASGARKKKESVPACILCKTELTVCSLEVLPERGGLWNHAASDLCGVRLTDAYGVSLDDRFTVENDGSVFEREDYQATDDLITLPTKKHPSFKPFVLDFPTFNPHEEALTEMFEHFKAPKLGGASGDSGWSSFFAFQRCPYFWYRQYIVGTKEFGTPPIPLVVGSLLHTFVAIHYEGKRDANYPFTADSAFTFLQASGINLDALNEAWRVFDAYRLFYQTEKLIPLSAEFHVVDPYTNESCRYDLIARLDEPPIGNPPGTYIVETKTTSRFDDSSLTGWVNDGEVIGQVMLYDRLKLKKRFGELQGVIVNLCGKHKIPQFQRVFVSPSRWQKKQHAKDLQQWKALRQFFLSADTFPRSRANCINRWGKCSQWDHCATGED